MFVVVGHVTVTMCHVCKTPMHPFLKKKYLPSNSKRQTSLSRVTRVLWLL